MKFMNFKFNFKKILLPKNKYSKIKLKGDAHPYFVKTFFQLKKMFQML